MRRTEPTSNSNFKDLWNLLTTNEDKSEKSESEKSEKPEDTRKRVVNSMLSAFYRFVDVPNASIATRPSASSILDVDTKMMKEIQDICDAVKTQEPEVLKYTKYGMYHVLQPFRNPASSRLTDAIKFKDEESLEQLKAVISALAASGASNAYVDHSDKPEMPGPWITSWRMWGSVIALADWIKELQYRLPDSHIHDGTSITIPPTDVAQEASLVGKVPGTTTMKELILSNYLTEYRKKGDAEPDQNTAQKIEKASDEIVNALVQQVVLNSNATVYDFEQAVLKTRQNKPDFALENNFTGDSNFDFDNNYNRYEITQAIINSLKSNDSINWNMILEAALAASGG